MVLINKISMLLGKSIELEGKGLQEQLMELLAAPQLQGRIMLGITQDFEWQQLKCVVPLALPLSSPQDFVTLTMLLRMPPNGPPSTPGLYLDTPLLPLPTRFINITEDLPPPSPSKTIKDVVMSTLHDIDSYGLLEWARAVYPAPLFHDKLYHNHPVNLKSSGNNQIICNYDGPNNKNSNNLTTTNHSNINNNNIPLQESLHILRAPTQNIYSAFRLINGGDEVSGKGFRNLGLLGQDEGDSAGDHGNQNGDGVKVEKCSQDGKIEIERTNGDDNSCSLKPKNKPGNSESLFGSGSFSLFRPVIQAQPKNNINNRCEVKVEDNGKSFVQIKHVPFENLPQSLANKISNLPIFNQTFIESTKKIYFQSPQPAGTSGEKTPKHPKPMNKNANLPKFLIRIFIKYVDKYKSMYVRRQYERLHSECKKMKQWKKNDRRQHAFGLKHLKIFFQDMIEGFPDPGLNRRVISKIIDNYLLEEICQNSQIPQSHRVGYLVACRVYSIRCRNVWLAGRIQSK